ncbi:MAG: hypothetical protein U1F57_01255 [bacterium]
MVFCLFWTAHAESSPLDAAQQAILVTTSDWNSVSGQLQRFERKGNAFQAVGTPVPIVVGLHGMAWGKGLNAAQTTDPQKKEGDGKAPAGIFDLGEAMGYAPSAPTGSAWPYKTISDSTYCVDDPTFASYNQITVLPAGKAPTWKSAEKMKRKDDLYKWLVFVNHNTGKPAPGAGSCVFMHVWRSPEKGTAGCTAMAEGNLVEVLKWLKPEQHPRLVQLPEGEYKKLKGAWGLP